MSKVTPTAARPTSPSATRVSRPDGTLSRDGRFRWAAVWERWVPTGKEEEIDLPGPLESGPLLPQRHSASCLCGDCMTAGQHYADYLKARRLRDEF